MEQPLSEGDYDSRMEYDEATSDCLRVMPFPSSPEAEIEGLSGVGGR